MSHRIREAMRIGGLAIPFGVGGGGVEVDETYIGRDLDQPAPKKKKKGFQHKHRVLSLIDRDTGQARSMVVDDMHWRALLPILEENISHEARILTDEGGSYMRVRVYFAAHETVNHKAEEYVRLSDSQV